MAPPVLPTDAELEILAILWDKESATVREVHDMVAARRPVAYTTTLKLMQIMVAKGLVERDTAERSHVYRARIPRERTQGALVQDLLDRAFGGSAWDLVQHALARERATPAELRRIRKLLRRMEEGS